MFYIEIGARLYFETHRVVCPGLVLADDPLYAGVHSRLYFEVIHYTSLQ